MPRSSGCVFFCEKNVTMSSKWGSSPTGSLVSASTTAAWALEIVLNVAI